MRRLLVAVSIASLFIGRAVWAIPPTMSISELPDLHQEPQHKVASKRVTNLLTRSHYHRFSLNNAFSEKIFDRYLQQLDYRRNVLTQADIDSFKPYQQEFDDMLKTGNLSAAYKIYQLAQERRYERFVYALSLLDKPMKFDEVGDAYVYDRKDAAWPKNEAELNELWRQRVKFDALNLKLAGKNWPEIVKVLSKRYNNAIKRITQTQSEDVFQTVMNAFARSVEPHTSYLSPRNAERFQMDMNLSLEGIGAVLQMSDDYTVIKSLVAGGPAAKSKQLSPEDKIVGVGQEGGEVVDVIGWRLDDVVDLIKGPKGTKVVLQILSNHSGANTEPVEVTIVRDKIRLEDRAAVSKVIEKETGPYSNRKLGVITIPSFYMNLSQDVAKEIAALKAKNVEGIVIDLRGNGGGALTEASRLTGLFIDTGPVVQIRDANGRLSQKKDTDGVTAYEGPLTILVDRYSASASEIFAAALQDYGRALIVGESTFGKGTVQQHKSLGRVYDMYNNPIGHVQYTIAKFYRINGGSTQLKGVTPDILYPSAFMPGEFGEANEDNPLPWDKVDHAKFSALGEVTYPMVSQLEIKHLARIKANPEFGYIFDDIKEYHQHQNDKSISLVQSEREQERKAEDSKLLKRANERRVAAGLKALKSLKDKAKDGKLEHPDPFLDETAYITLDMIDVEQMAKNNHIHAG